MKPLSSDMRLEAEAVQVALLRRAEVSQRLQLVSALVRVTRQSRSRWLETFDQRRDPRGRAYYWLKGGRRQTDPDPDSDEQAVRHGYVSVTPITIDLTSYQHLAALEGLQSHAP